MLWFQAQNLKKAIWYEEPGMSATSVLRFFGLLQFKEAKQRIQSTVSCVLKYIY